MLNKLINGSIIFVLLNMVISIVWYIIEYLTYRQIMQNDKDTFICLGLSLVLTLIINNKHVINRLNKK